MSIRSVQSFDLKYLKNCSRRTCGQDSQRSVGAWLRLFPSHIPSRRCFRNASPVNWSGCGRGGNETKVYHSFVRKHGHVTPRPDSKLGLYQPPSHYLSSPILVPLTAITISLPFFSPTLPCEINGTIYIFQACRTSKTTRGPHQ
jgi:hypothetical protein